MCPVGTSNKSKQSAAATNRGSSFYNANIGTKLSASQTSDMSRAGPLQWTFQLARHAQPSGSRARATAVDPSVHRASAKLAAPAAREGYPGNPDGISWKPHVLNRSSGRAASRICRRSRKLCSAGRKLCFNWKVWRMESRRRSGRGANLLRIGRRRVYRERSLRSGPRQTVHLLSLFYLKSMFRRGTLYQPKAFA